jgi:hypothetical protein
MTTADSMMPCCTRHQSEPSRLTQMGRPSAHLICPSHLPISYKTAWPDHHAKRVHMKTCTLDPIDPLSRTIMTTPVGITLVDRKTIMLDGSITSRASDSLSAEDTP